MKFITISDTHSKHKQIPKEWLAEADCIIHAGDISSMGYLHEIKAFCDWFSSLDYKYKIFIGGNHDFSLEPINKNYSQALDLVTSYTNIDYLEDDYIKLLDNDKIIKVYGSPWQPEFHHWAFNLKRNGVEIEEKWRKIPKDTDILITHGPVRGILDYVPYNGGEIVGDELLLNEVMSRIKPKVHICGHIHYSYGEVLNDNIHFINASTANEQYQMVNKPIIFEI